MIDFLRTLYLRKLDSRTVARHLVTIRHLFRFAFTEGMIKEDPAANVAAPKFRRSLPEFLSVAEVDRLLRQPDVTSALGLRDKAMIELLYSTGPARLRTLRPASCRHPARGRLPALPRQRQ